MTKEITERRRSKLPAIKWGVSAGAIAAGAAWVCVFGFTPDAHWDLSTSERMAAAIDTLWRATREGVNIYGRLPFGHYEPILDSLQDQGRLSTFFGRVALVALASVAAALPLARWRFVNTPRRLGTDWLSEDDKSHVPRWSEGADAVTNANATLAPEIARTGRGLEIAPGVALSKAHEALSILAIGDRGSGKTVFFWHLIFELRRTPTLMVVHDTKGDMTARWPDDSFLLLAPQDTRSIAWAVGRDLIGEVAAREFAILLVKSSDREPTWPAGAQEIFVGVIITLQRELGTAWGWIDIKNALALPDADLREFACRYHPQARAFLALEEQNFTRTAQSFVSTLMAPINRLIAPLAKAWGDVTDPTYQISLRTWLDDPSRKQRVLILQRAPDMPAMSAAWIGAAVQVMMLHLLATRKDRNAADRQAAKQEDCWFLLDEFRHLGRIPAIFEVLEVGRSLGLRAAIGVQNFQQVARVYDRDAPSELLQLASNLVAFRLNPGKDSALICNERMTTAKVRIWKTDDDGKRKASSQEIAILPQDDLARLRLTRDGPNGFFIVENDAFRLSWPFPELPVQREGTIRSKWIES